jgi:hypothetical protein
MGIFLGERECFGVGAAHECVQSLPQLPQLGVVLDCFSEFVASHGGMLRPAGRTEVSTDHTTDHMTARRESERPDLA